MAVFDDIKAAIQEGKAKVVAELVTAALADGISAEEILDKGMIAAMNAVGEKFRDGDIFIPEVIVAARAMNRGAALLKPALASEGVQAKGTVIIGTVQGDMHDIGKNLVKMMMEGRGINVVDLGVDVPAEAFVEAAKENNAQIICCSALLTTTMEQMESVVKACTDGGIRDKVKIFVGGAPVTESYCKKIGADVYTADAASAAMEAIKLLAV